MQFNICTLLLPLLATVQGSILSHGKSKPFSLSHFGTSIIGNQVIVLLGEQVDHKNKGVNSRLVYSLDVNKDSAITKLPWVTNEIQSGVSNVHSLACEVLNSNSDEIVCFGGYFTEKLAPVQGPFLGYNHTNGNWTELILSDKTPSSRFGHEMLKMGDDNIYLFGGKVLNEELKKTELEVWKLNNKKEWKLVEVEEKNSQLTGNRYYSTMTRISGEKFILIGGRNDQEAYGLDKVYIFDIKANKWEEKITTEFPDIKVAEHSAVFYNNNIIIYGGSDFNNKKNYNQLYQLNIQNWKWNEIKLDNELANRYGHKAIIIQDSMLVYFGVTSPPSLTTQLINLKDFKVIESLQHSDQKINLEQQNGPQIQTTSQSHTLFTIIIVILVFALLGYLWYRRSVKHTIDFKPLPTGEEPGYDDLEFEEFEPSHK
ncbi:galactose oxidase [Neoconidiobolus thromboides FSU 785]|nr:galactose oxidase [Neoconidiobolus thromboides FSU 785]